MTTTELLYRAARMSANLRAVKNHRVVKRVRNIAVGRLLARAGFWRRLWR
ncbi:MAG: hypothetical protein WAL84_02305 [Candidatus Dormiibacterota bacterium]